jgi:PAS domain S-box-containing protein
MKNLLLGISDANNHLLKERNISEALQLCITALGKNISIDRCYIFKNEIINNALILNYEYEWCNDGIEPYIGSPELSGHTYDSFPGLYETLIQNLPMYGNVNDSQNEFFREVMEMQGIKSFLFAPIFSDGNFWGWIGFDDCKTEREWKIEEVKAIHTVAINIGIRLNHLKTILELEISEQKFRFIAENTSDIIMQHLVDGTITYVSSNCSKILGYKENELINKDPYSFFHPDDIDRVLIQHANIIQFKTEIATFRFRKKNETYIWLETYSKVILDSNKKVIGVQTSSRDITERIKDQEEIKQALEKERELNELKTGFVSIASHQFRTPLTVIYSNIELLNHKISKTNSSLKTDIKIISDRIFSEIDRMTELMNNILIFGKYESNNLKIEIKEFELTNFIEKLIETYFNQEKDGRKISFEKIGYEKKIQSDESLLLHILTNLISNAFKYSKDSPNPIIRVNYYENNFKIEVIDFGIGIPIIETKHLFQSFFRGSNTSSIKGSGLGLIIAKQFSELLNGVISISSEENKGTVVTIVFPNEQN